ncbi:MAG: COX15/CtaA family protein [Spirosomaceae bacterium]|nr:COX15/CtaA family protein [Spirosomataceae bacterium]
MDKSKAFRRWGMATLIALYFLILIGGVVRATGAGMGCPDWPKCFGMWIPPTVESELPLNYKEIFGAKLKGEVVFNPVKTWIEYVNRLVGALIGLFIFGTFVLSVRTFWKSDKPIVGISLLTLLLVLFEGWLGSIVVSTELHPGMITLHMLIAIVIVALILYIVLRSYEKRLPIEEFSSKQALNFLVIVLIVISIGQVLMGTQVRESVDVLLKTNNREVGEGWLSVIGGKFYMHIALSFVLLVMHYILLRNVKSSTVEKGLIYKTTTYLFAVVLIEIVSGSIMALFEIPAFAQPVHLLFGIVVLGMQFSIFLLMNREYVANHSMKIA